MTKLENALNLGPKTTKWLADLSIFTLDDLERIGVVETYIRLRKARPQQVTRNALWALQGALLDLPWNELPVDLKQNLIAKVEEYEN